MDRWLDGWMVQYDREYWVSVGGWMDGLMDA